MKSAAVLLMGSSDKTDIAEATMDLGFALVVRSTTLAALERLRHETFAAVLVEEDRVDFDVLEFVLNVRDVDEEIPVVVADRAADQWSQSTLRALGRTYIVNNSCAPEKVASKIEHAVKAAEGQETS
jgi:DNA-binding NtrC family response regulator